MQNVSFIIPSYNAQNTIAKTIKSIQEQKYKGKIEIIVIDDCSKDNSIKVISEYKKVKLIKNESNLGLSRSLNKAIKQSKHDLLCIIWCDCILESKSWLNEMIKVYNENKNCFVGSKLVIPKEYWDKFSFWDKAVVVKDYETSLKNKQREGRPTLFDKKALFEARLYDTKTFRTAGEDTDLRWKLDKLGYKFITAKVNILHLHGFYKFSLKKQLINKALTLAEAIGANFRRHGIKSLPNNYWNPLTSTILYFSLLIPYINIISFIIVLFILIKYTLNTFKFVKDKKIIILPLFKLLKDIITIVGFWKGFFTGKQKF